MSKSKVVRGGIIASIVIPLFGIFSFGSRDMEFFTLGIPCVLLVLFIFGVVKHNAFMNLQKNNNDNHSMMIENFVGHSVSICTAFTCLTMGYLSLPLMEVIVIFPGIMSIILLLCIPVSFSFFIFCSLSLYKPFPVKYIRIRQKMNSGFGVMLESVVIGVISGYLATASCNLLFFAYMIYLLQ